MQMLTKFYRDDDNVILAALVHDHEVEDYLKDRQSHNFFSLYYLPKTGKHIVTEMSYYDLLRLPKLSERQVRKEAPKIFDLISIFE